MEQKEFQPGMIFVTAPTPEVAESLAQKIIAEKLAACVSMHAVTSVYRWQAQTHRDSEVQLVIKTNISNASNIIEHIKQWHPYEVPEIVAVPITNGLPEYINWLKEHTT